MIQSNGCIKAAIKIAKNIIKKSEDTCTGLPFCRWTPLENGYSPAELIFSRKIRSTVPLISSKFGSFRDRNKVSIKEKQRKEKQASDYNQWHRFKNLPILKFDNSVWISNLKMY